MNSAPYRPAFVLWWIFAFTALLAAAFGVLIPGEAQTPDSRERVPLVLPRELPTRGPAPALDGQPAPQSDPALEPATSIIYTTPDGGLNIRGTVLDEHAVPCAAAKVELLPGEGYPKPQGGAQAVRTALDGTFQVGPLPRKGYATLVAVHRNVRSRPVQVDLARWSAQDSLRLEVNIASASVAPVEPAADITAGRPATKNSLNPAVFGPPAVAAVRDALPPLRVSFDAPRGFAAVQAAGPFPTRYEVAVAAQPDADGLFTMFVSAYFEEEDDDEESLLTEEEILERALHNAYDQLPALAQQQLREARQAVRRLGESDLSMQGKKARIMERVRSMRTNNPKVANFVARLTPQQAAKARNLLEAEIRRILRERSG